MPVDTFVYNIVNNFNVCSEAMSDPSKYFYPLKHTQKQKSNTVALKASLHLKVMVSTITMIAMMLKMINVLHIIMKTNHEYSFLFLKSLKHYRA